MCLREQLDFYSKIKSLLKKTGFCFSIVVADKVMMQ